MIDILRKFISLSHKVALAATIRLFSTKAIVLYNRQTYYYVDNVIVNVAQYKFQNYNCIATFFDKHKKCVS